MICFSNHPIRSKESNLTDAPSPSASGFRTHSQSIVDGYYQLGMDKYLAEKDIVLNPPMKVQSIEAVKRCVMNNLGIAVVPTYSIGEELKNGSPMLI